MVEAVRTVFDDDKARAVKSLGASYATTVLDRACLDRMLANRVSMGTGPAATGLCGWARFRATKAAIQMHTLLDLRGPIPAFGFLDHGNKISLVDPVPVSAIPVLG